MATRKTIIAEILKIMKPHFYDSGYNKALDPTKGLFGPKRKLQIYRNEDYVLFDGFVLKEMIALSEDGPITDATGGGCVIESFSRFPLEDLILIRDWAKTITD